MWSYLCESRIASRFSCLENGTNVPPLWQATYLGNAVTSCMAVAMTDLFYQGSQAHTSYLGSTPVDVSYLR